MPAHAKVVVATPNSSPVWISFTRATVSASLVGALRELVGISVHYSEPAVRVTI